MYKQDCKDCIPFEVDFIEKSSPPLLSFTLDIGLISCSSFDSGSLWNKMIYDFVVYPVPSPHLSMYIPDSHHNNRYDIITTSTILWSCGIAHALHTKTSMTYYYYSGPWPSMYKEYLQFNCRHC